MDEWKTPEFTVRPSDSFEKQALVQSLKNDTAVHRLFRTQSIPEEELNASPYMISRWRTSLEVCRGCQSLNTCRQKKTGYRMGISYDGLLQETLEACPYERERLKAESHLAQYTVSDLGPSFRTVSFETIPLDGESGDYVRTVLEVSSLYEAHQGAYIYGNMGTGKTYLCACAANRAAGEGHSTAFVHYPSFCERIAATSYSGEYRREADLLRAAWMLVIDDIGAEEVTGRNRQVLLSILDARMQSGKMTWFSGNGDLNTLQNHLRYSASGEDTAASDRIIERIRTLAKPVYLDGADRRSSAAG
ncbi:MAG: ATP-binding protein [Solobacterium sp.]|nr:ATP-binding protein [Solobacterium sp.]